MPDVQWDPPAPADHLPDDLVAKVTGAAKYATDLEFPHAAHAALVRSRVPHGLIRGIDTTAAEAHPQIVCVLTGADLLDMDPYYGEQINDQPVLALDRVRYVGEPVCAVVAETRAAAVAAATLVSMDIEPMPGMFSCEAALAEDAVTIHPHREGTNGSHPNICKQAVHQIGDVDAAFARAAYVHDAVYRCPAIFHYAMEPHCSIGWWQPDGIEVISGTQQPSRVREGLARMFRVPRARVQVRAPFVGGAYGGKGEMKYEPLVVTMSRKARRPVKLVCSIEESFHTVTRHAASVRIRTAVDGNGTMIARDSEILFDTGAYADKGGRIAARAAHRVSGPYAIPNLRAVASAVYTNIVPAGAFRGFSTSQVLWAEESAMDEIAEAVGEDPVQYRLRHLIDRGDRFVGIDSPMDADLKGGLQTAAAAIRMHDLTLPFTGRGIGVGVKDGGGGAAQAAATVRLHLDGSVEVHAGATELGQGSFRVLGAIAANELGVPRDRVAVRLGDTATSPFDRGTNASRSSVGIGKAIVDACDKIRTQLAEALGATGMAADFRLEGDQVVVGDERILLQSLLAKATSVPGRELGFLLGQGVHNVGLDPTSGRSQSLFYEVCFSTADVQVDPETGQIRLRRFVSVTDAGKVLDRHGSEGQDLGAAMMGIGSTLSEQLLYQDGHLTNANLVDYRVPTTDYLPRDGFESILIENEDGPGPYGSRGLGEGGIIAVAPAIANAVYQAAGVRIRDLPLTPAAVWAHLNPQVGKD